MKKIFVILYLVIQSYVIYSGSASGILLKRQNKKIYNASKQIIVLMQNQGSYYEKIILNQIKKREAQYANNWRKDVFGNIRRIIVSFLACKYNNGDRINDFFECEYMEQNICVSLGGRYNPCASACRHQKEYSFCLLECRPVCTF